MNVRNIILITTFLLLGNSLFSQTEDSVIIKNPYRKVQKITYHPAQYRYTSTPRNYISDFALGMDYSQESFVNKADMTWDSSSTYLGNASGFNMYGLVMPKRIQNWKMASPRMGSFNWGFGFNVNQFHKSKKERVVINTVNQDSAHTRLETAHVSFYSLARYELAIGRFNPFIGLQAGASFISTNQVTETYMTLRDYESRAEDNIHTRVATYAAPELGVRFRMNSWASLVVSHEWKFGSQVDLSDVNNTQFDGAQMTATQQSVNYESTMWKFGILFDLSSNHRKKELIKDAYYDTTMVLERIYEDKPQPCPPCPCETKTTEPSRTQTIPNKKTDLEVNPADSKPMVSPSAPTPATPSVPNTIRMPKKAMPSIIKPTIPKKKS